VRSFPHGNRGKETKEGRKIGLGPNLLRHWPQENGKRAHPGASREFPDVPLRKNGKGRKLKGEVLTLERSREKKKRFKKREKRVDPTQFLRKGKKGERRTKRRAAFSS